MESIRLQKHIAELGICSRRKAEELIDDGLVKINGKVAKLGDKTDPTKDEIRINNKIHKPKYEALNLRSYVYIVLNKPIDYISSATNSQGKSVLDLLVPENNIKPGKRIELKQRVYPVGRLDKDSEGLILLTNDGDLAQKLTHPKFEHEKEYEVFIDRHLEKNAKKLLERGMKLDEEFVNGIKILKETNLGKRVIITVVLKEGKNRQIRKMFGRLGYNILSLKRTRIAKLKLGVLPPGRWKLVKKENII